MTNKTMIAKAVKTALFGGLAASIAITSPVTFAAEEESETIVVTGSRLKRTDIEGPSPVTIIDIEQIENSGKETVADVLREGPWNSFGSFNQRSGSSAQSQATVDLLGAGAQRTLVLLDGKRLPGSPSLGGTSINLNTLPLAAVERIEILRDGASAIYGSDAVSGVINIVTKKDYEGLNITARVDRPSLEGADSESVQMVTGVSSDRGSITFALDHYTQDAIFDGDRPYTAARFADLDGDGIIERGIETDGISNFGATITNPTTGLFEPSPLCDQLTQNVPGFVGVLGEGNNASRGFVCGYAYANISANLASTKRKAAYVNADYQVSDDVNFTARAMYSHNNSFGRYAPPAAPWIGGVPVGNANNPYSTPVAGRFRWYQLGNRDNNIDDYMQDYIIGFDGTFGESAEWELYYHYNQQDNKSVGATYLSVSGLFANILNNVPFDSEDGLNALSATTLNEDRNRFHQLFAGVSFEAGELGGGAIQHYIGAETFEIAYQALVDAQSEGGNVGGSAGNSAARDRDIEAVFYEANLPFTDNFTVNLAARYDKYNDFGSEVSPKVSFEYRPTDGLLLRGSWGQGFRAPTLQELSRADSFSASDAFDYVSCAAQGISAVDCSEDQHNDTRQSNANLGAETSTYINFGASWDISDDFNATLDYSQLEVEDVITFINVQDLIFNELAGNLVSTSTDLDGDGVNETVLTLPGYADVSLIRENNGIIREAFTQSVNGPTFEIKNLSLAFDYTLPTDSAGDFHFYWNTNYILEYNLEAYFLGPVQDQIGWNANPQWRSNLLIDWKLGDHSIAWNTDYIDGHGAATDLIFDSSGNLDGRLRSVGELDSFMTHNIRYQYDAGDYGRYFFGARNLFEEDVVLASDGTYPRGHFDLYTAGHIGRTYYAGFSIDL